MTRPTCPWLLLLLIVSFSPPAAGTSTTEDCPSNATDCWSDWSPCTVRCKMKGARTEFDRKWRIWQCLSGCFNGTRSQPEFEFAPCDYRVPFCLWYEDDPAHISTRTVTRLSALFIGIFLLAVPTILICCRYTPGHPLVCFCCRRRNKTAKRQRHLIAANEQ